MELNKKGNLPSNQLENKKGDNFFISGVVKGNEKEVDRYFYDEIVYLTYDAFLYNTLVDQARIEADMMHYRLSSENNK